MDTVAPAAVVCDDRALVRHILTSLLSRHGFSVTCARDLAGLERAALAAAPAVAVLGLPVAGAPGMQAVRRVLEAAPACSVLVLSPFATMDLAAVEAGAVALLDEDDVVGLEAALRTAFPQVPPPRPAGEPGRQPAGSGSAVLGVMSAAVAGRLRTNPSR